MKDSTSSIQEELAKRLQQLPKVVQNAILSADIEKHLRTLADTQKLHLDQWQKLENEVMFTLLGIQRIEDLEKNIISEVGVTADVASQLAENINTIVFEPIREELERQLEHPEAQEKEISAIDASRTQILGDESAATAPQEAATDTAVIPAAIKPATPPAPVPTIKATRPSESTAYKPGEVSSERAAVHDDPYREPPL